MSLHALLLATGVLLAPAALASIASAGSLGPGAVQSTVERLVEIHGASRSEDIRRGVRQVAERWWAEDGDDQAFQDFCLESYLPDEADRDAVFRRIQTVLEETEGRMHEIRREVTTPMDLDTGPIGPADRLFANLDPSAHLNDDLFRTRIAFLALLNFPVHTLAERLAQGASWDRETWARSRMMDRFAVRVPAAVAQEITRAATAASNYIDEYNIYMGRVVTPDGRRLFPDDLRLVSHWGLRDHLKSDYDDPEGLEKQRIIRRIMERIARQEIPRVVIDNPGVLWCPETNEVRPLEAGGPAPPSEREPDTRYRRLLDVFHAVRRADAYVPSAPTYIARRFDLERQIPEKEVEALLVSVLASPEAKDLAALIRERLGRPLEPFDIWYPGLKARPRVDEAELDSIVRAKYPTREAFHADLPRILRHLGFSEDKARWVAEHIVVDPARGAGHALGAVRRADQAHLRTRIAPEGMNYKGFNIAVHELGHNVEQVFSLNAIDHWWLSGVPNNAFTEALAFVFQARDLELLDLPGATAGARSEEALETLWNTFEIGGVALVDMQVWRWMYAHPDATPAQLREATLAAAREVWNRYYAPLFGLRDQEILAIYSHMISYALYLSDYPIGHVIDFQIGGKLRAGDFGAEFERMARQGRLTPDAWMRGAVGSPLSSAVLLTEARSALEAARQGRGTGP